MTNEQTTENKGLVETSIRLAYSKLVDEHCDLLDKYTEALNEVSAKDKRADVLADNLVTDEARIHNLSLYLYRLAEDELMTDCVLLYDEMENERMTAELVFLYLKNKLLGAGFEVELPAYLLEEFVKIAGDDRAKDSNYGACDDKQEYRPRAEKCDCGNKCSCDKNEIAAEDDELKAHFEFPDKPLTDYEATVLVDEVYVNYIKAMASRIWEEYQDSSSGIVVNVEVKEK